jgi:hypothetical protein
VSAATWTEVLISGGRTASRKGKEMGTRVKGMSMGPATVIVAASSKLPGTGGWRRKRTKGVLRRNMAALPRAVGRVGTAVRQLERAGMILAAVATGMELVREIRFAGSNGQSPRGGKDLARSSRSRSGSATQKNRTASNKTGGSRTVRAARSRAGTKSARGTRSKAKKTARSRGSATRTRTSGRPRSSAGKQHKVRGTHRHV